MRSDQQTSCYVSRYRKSFEVDASVEGKLVYLDFDGVYRAADFWLNGEWIGHHESGYAPFRWYTCSTKYMLIGKVAGPREIFDGVGTVSLVCASAMLRPSP